MDKFIKISSVTKKKILLKDENNNPLLIKYEHEIGRASCRERV
mgnify:CR=1 FL=1